MSKERLFSFRWDIDHRACMTDGVPRILSICDEFGVPNTFFVNMGRSTNLKEWLGKGLAGSRAKLTDADSINLIEKIGFRRFAIETILQRPVGSSFIRELKILQDKGHELGLHGGTDHVVWSRRFPVLPETYIRDDVEGVLEGFHKHFGMPAGFASPGFKSDDRVMRLVSDFGFRYNGDGIGGRPMRATAGGVALSHWTIPVTICGPRTIPFLEWHGARKTSESEIFSDLDALLRDNDLVVFYGHPCYEGVHSELLKRVFSVVLERGYKFVTHKEIASRLEDPESEGDTGD